MTELENVEPPIRLSANDIKAIVRHRDGYRCTECGLGAAEHLLRYGRNLDVHRTTPGGSYTVSGCVTLCRECHKGKPKSPNGTSTARGDWISRALTQFRLSRKPLYAALKAYARYDGRSLRSVFLIAVKEFLQQEGFWPPPEDE